MKPIKEGKVREIYDNGDSLILVATDRISCFDVILNNTITRKGTVLTQMSKFWFDMTQDILPNHMITTDVNEMPEFFRQPQFDGNSMMCRKLNMLPVECIVRGYITGSGWASYQKDGTVCGITLPEGLKESDKLPEPIYTPSTKAEIGDHDENISYEQSIAHLEKYFPGKGEEYAQKLRDLHHRALQKMRGLRTEPRHHHRRYEIRVRSGRGWQHRARRRDAHTGQLTLLAGRRIRAGTRTAVLRQTVRKRLAESKPGQRLDASG